MTIPATLANSRWFWIGLAAVLVILAGAVLSVFRGRDRKPPPPASPPYNEAEVAEQRTKELERLVDYLTTRALFPSVPLPSPPAAASDPAETPAI